MSLRSLPLGPRALLSILTLLAVLGLVSVPQAMAQQSQARSKASTKTPADSSKPEDIEKRIADLRQAMQITPAQEPVWNDLAKVMRENAGKMKAFMDKWSAQYDKINAVENLKAHLEMADENARAMRQLIPAFEKLYSSMADDQKKIADDVFAYRKEKSQKKAR